VLNKCKTLKNIYLYIVFPFYIHDRTVLDVTNEKSYNRLFQLIINIKGGYIMSII